MSHLQMSLLNIDDIKYCTCAWKNTQTGGRLYYISTHLMHNEQNWGILTDSYHAIYVISAKLNGEIGCQMHSSRLEAK